MLYFTFKFAPNDGTIEAVTADAFEYDRDRPYTYRGDFETMEQAEYIADCLNNLHRNKSQRGVRNYLAIDNGAYCSPRYDVIELPQVGDDVSYGFNGDSYPCGQIKSISKSLKVITTTGGEKFYRRKQTGTWKMHKTWSLMKGHHNDRNPHF
jgi:hypothetical protein